MNAATDTFQGFIGQGVFVGAVPAANCAGGGNSCSGTDGGSRLTTDSAFALVQEVGDPRGVKTVEEFERDHVLLFGRRRFEGISQQVRIDCDIACAALVQCRSRCGPAG